MLKQLLSNNESVLAKLNANDIAVIESAITKKLELQAKDLSNKFDAMVEGLENKFDKMVTKSLNESASEQISTDANNKLLGVLQEVANLLEGSGIIMTEKTKEVMKSLELTNKRISEEFETREKLIRELEASKISTYILTQLQGLDSKVIQAAQEHFKGKEYETVIDELEDFVKGDFSNIDMSDEYSDGLGDLTLDKLEDIMDEISVEGFNNNNKFVEASQGKRVPGGSRMMSITDDMLNTTSSILESEGHAMHAETKDAMAEIMNFSNTIHYGSMNHTDV